MGKPKLLKDTGKLDKHAWIAVATELLSNSGASAVLIEPLAKSLGVTKGSFYWHFKDRAELLEEVLNLWRQRATLRVIERLEQSREEPDAQIHKLLEFPVAGPRASLGTSLELAIRLWAKTDARAAMAVEEVDKQRLGYITALLSRRGIKLPEASARAFLIYSYMLAESFVRSNRSRKAVELSEKILLDLSHPD